MIERITIQHVPSEDRIRMNCSSATKPDTVIWLSRRLLDKLLPHLVDLVGGYVDFMEETSPSLDGQPLKEADQTGDKDINSCCAWLATSVDVSVIDANYCLAWRSDRDHAATVCFSREELCQFLICIRRCYSYGQWHFSSRDGSRLTAGSGVETIH